MDPGHPETPGPRAAQDAGASTGACADELGDDQADDQADDTADDPADGDIEDMRSSFVRPYVWTSGRTSTTLDLALETLVSASGAVAHDELTALRHEYRCVLELCERPRSVTEIAANLSLPLGAAKALLGDMAEDGLVVVHDTAKRNAEGPDLALMERVLHGLRRL
jgi:hypothetical protein